MHYHHPSSITNDFINIHENNSFSTDNSFVQSLGDGLDRPSFDHPNFFFDLNLQNRIEIALQRAESILREEPTIQRSSFQSPNSYDHILRRVYSMEDLRSIDCENAAILLASTFPNDPSLNPLLNISKNCLSDDKSQLLQSYKCEYR